MDESSKKPRFYTAGEIKASETVSAVAYFMI